MGEVSLITVLNTESLKIHKTQSPKVFKIGWIVMLILQLIDTLIWEYGQKTNPVQVKPVMVMSLSL